MKRARRAALLYLGVAAAVLVVLWLSESSDVGEDEVGVGVLTRAVLSVAVALGAPEPTAAVGCYNDDDVAAEEGALRDVSEDDEPPRAGSIFFHETSCRSSGASRLELGPRQACAVESAARNNPGLQVYVLFASPAARNSSSWSWAARQLLSYPNVHIRHVNVERYLRGTPLEDLYTSGALRKSYWPMSHTSDVMRFLTLWRYGGTYMDLDVVLTKSLEGVQNFAGAESSSDVAVGVLNLGGDELGRRVADDCIRDIKENFRGDKWGHNGPGVMTRVLQRLCGVQKSVKMTPGKCGGFTVYPPTAFYPVSWDQWELYFDESTSSSTMQQLRNSIAIHVWNKFSKGREVKVGSIQPYGLIAEKHCPRVYRRSAPVF